MIRVDYLELDDLMAAAEAGVGPVEIRDVGLLESALGRPRATAYGQDAYPDIHTKAAALLHSLATNHGLVDGNKRLAWVATRLFYGMNGWDIVAGPEEKFDLVMAVASGEIDDVPKLAGRLRLMARVGCC